MHGKTPASGTAPKPGRATIATLLAASTLTVMAGATISPALPLMQARFADVGHSRLLVELLLTLPAALIAITATFAGRIAAGIGGRRLLLASLGLYVVAGTSGLWLNDLFALLAGRALLGVAVAGVMTAATGLIGDLFPGPQRARVLGWQASAISAGGLVFLLAGGALADVSWRGPFAVYAAALLLYPAALSFISAPERKTASDERSDPGQPTQGVLPVTAALVFILSLAFYVVPTKLPFRLRELEIEGGLAAGVAVAAAVVASGIASALAGRVRHALGAAWAAGGGLILLGTGLVGVGLLDSYPALLVSLVVLGSGSGVLQPVLMTTALGSVRGGTTSKAAGIMTAALFLGQFVSPLVSSPLETWLGLAMAYVLVGAATVAAGLLVAVVRPAALSNSSVGRSA